MVVALVGLASVATVLLPGGYLDPVLAKVEGAMVQPAQAAPMDCTLDMAEMQMAVSADCTSR